MAEFRFGVTGKECKNFVNAVSEILNQPKQYLGTPSYAFSVDDYVIDRESTLIGEYNKELLLELTARGFTQAEISSGTFHEATAESDAEDTLKTETEPEENEAEAEETTETDTISITLPLDGFTPETLDNLCKMVISKATLIQKALGVDAIPIKVLDNGIEFPWFRAEHSNGMMAFAQFLSALCSTAKEKKRVTAKPPEHYENERFAMRVWLIGLGLIGGEYSRIRKLLTSPLTGNSSWRYFQNEIAVEETASAPQTAEESPADETLEDARAAAEDANVGDINADTTEAEGEVLA